MQTCWSLSRCVRATGVRVASDHLSLPHLHNIDAGAAIGFITNTCSIGRMKHIDLRESWVEQLRRKDCLEWIKVPGPENRADTFTKILNGTEFQKGTAGLMVPLPNQGGMLQ